MDQNEAKKLGFQAAMPFVVLFYGILLLWTVGTVPLIWEKFQDGWLKGDWHYAAIIAFFYAYTWFWALGLIYFISLDPDGRVVMRSLRRRWEVSAKQIRTIEGSRFSGGFGFIRFKMPRESGYLFCLRRTRELDEILQGIRQRNPLLKVVRI